MLREEADWLRGEIAKLNHIDSVFPMGNIGSSDDGQNNFQPWVADLIAALRSNGEVKNIDIKPGNGVDLIGDLLDPGFINQLKEMNFKSFLCANILTNITARNQFVAALTDLVPKEGYLIVTVSHRYPYVADPVDTKYRPDLAELAGLFPGFRVVTQKLVLSQSFAKLLFRRKKIFFITMARMFVPFYKIKTWWNLVCYLPHVFKPVSASCLVLKK